MLGAQPPTTLPHDKGIHRTPEFQQFKAELILSLGSCTKLDSFILVYFSHKKHFHKVCQETDCKHANHIYQILEEHRERKNDFIVPTTFFFLQNMNSTTRICIIFVKRIILCLKVPRNGRNSEKTLGSKIPLLCVSTGNLTKKSPTEPKANPPQGLILCTYALCIGRIYISLHH